MYLPLQLVLEFLGRSAAWLAVMTAIGALIALMIVLTARRPVRSAWPGPVAGGVLGALLGASLAHRFGLPEAFTFDVWCRAILLAWSAGGAAAGAIAAVLWRMRRPAPAQPPPEQE